MLLKANVEVASATTFEKGGILALPFWLPTAKHAESAEIFEFASALSVYAAVNSKLPVKSAKPRVCLKCDKIRKLWYNMPNFTI